MSTQPFCILHVEDDANDVLLVHRAFRKSDAPARVTAVSDGDQAVAYLQGADEFNDRDKYPTPHLVLLDLKMPRKSGLEVLGWIRAQSHLRRLIVIVFTSSKHDQDVNQAYELGANSYLVKPVGFDSLSETIRSISHYWGTLNQVPATT